MGMDVGTHNLLITALGAPKHWVLLQAQVSLGWQDPSRPQSGSLPLTRRGHSRGLGADSVQIDVSPHTPIETAESSGHRSPLLPE